MKPAEPPHRVWVSFCTKCGAAICADATHRGKTSCPDCPRTRSGGPKIHYARYEIVLGVGGRKRIYDEKGRHR